MINSRVAAFVLSLSLCSGLVKADDWPQWMGPNRDNVWSEDGVLESFPDAGLKVLWRTEIAGGYAGPAVSNGRVFVTDYTTADDVKVSNFEREQFSGQERVLCLDEKTGKKLWSHDYPVKYTVSYPSGPRCTPTVDGDRVYVLGTEGNLFCFNVADGEMLWSKDFKTDYGAKTALWGYASHPLVDGNKLICVVGGEGSHAVAFDKLTGKELWRTLSSKEQGYSPPMIIEHGGMRQLILFRPGAVSAVNPETGKEYWSVPYEATNGSVIMTPIHKGNLLYCAGYSNKNMLIKMADDGKSAEIAWEGLTKQAISPVNVQPFRVDDIVYGFDQSGLLHAMDLETGDRIWGTGAPLNSERPVGSGTAFMVRQGNRVWMFNELGELLIAKLSREGYEEIDRVKVIDQTNNAFGREVVWSMPAFANRHVYIRNDKEIICVDVSK
ncbi:MAG: PQQ-like beta-propeller repeat protein [Planctomycetaceae bacterium]|nr:PQQ-like beta-propeller repeat protein [Planctomycetaceae bacterium]